MIDLDELYVTLKPSLPGITERQMKASLRGLEGALHTLPRRRAHLRLKRLRFDGEKRGDFRFYPGVNVLRAGNDKGKSSILKLIHFCLCGKNELKKDVDGWIHRVELAFELDGVPHAIGVDKRRRPRGRLVVGDLDDLEHRDSVLTFENGRDMQRRLETFFNEAFGLRPLMGTQKDPRKGSDALLDSPTSYRAYLRGMYINQDVGYTDLVTDGVPYGNLFMKIVGMLLGIRGIDAFFAVESRRAHCENTLGKEERYHRRVEQSLGLRDLATLDQEIERLEQYIDERKVERTALLVRATSDDLDRRLAELTNKLVALDSAYQQTLHKLQQAELEQAATEGAISELEEALASQRIMSPIQPDRCPVCETRLEGRRQEAAAGHCVLCHEEAVPRSSEPWAELLAERQSAAQSSLDKQRQRVAELRGDLDGLEARTAQLGQQKRHAQAQLRSVHQGTAELEREIELETRFLGRLEAERDSAARLISGEGGSRIQEELQRKQILGAVLRHLRTVDSEINERAKRELAGRVLRYCTTIGLPGLEEVTLDAQLRPRIRQNGKVYTFDGLSPGEKVRFTLAFYLALAVVTAEELEFGAHPGLLLIDSPGKEEMVLKDFEAVVELLHQIEERHADSIQVLVATTIPAIHGATAPEKQIFVADDDEPLFS